MLIAEMSKSIMTENWAEKSECETMDTSEHLAQYKLKLLRH